MPNATAGLEALGLKRVPRQERARDKVWRALEAADAIARAEGVEAVTLPRVAAEAEVSVGALYQYLPDRDAIVAALVARYHARLEALFDTAIDEAAAWEDPIDRLIDAVAGIYRDEEGARSLGGVAGGAALDEARASHKAAMAGRISALLTRVGLQQGADADAAAHVAFTASDAVMHEAFGASLERREALLGELRAMLRAYLGPLLRASD